MWTRADSDPGRPFQIPRTRPAPVRFSRAALRECRVLVIANAGSLNAGAAAAPAFSLAEIDAVRLSVEDGGALLLIADHRPYGAHAIAAGRNASEAVSQVRTFTGQAFRGPASAEPLLVFRSGFMLLPDRPARMPANAATTDIDGWLQGAVMRVGRGRAAFFGEAAMFSAQHAGPTRQPMGMNAPEAERNHQFVLNVLHWLTGLLD